MSVAISERCKVTKHRISHVVTLEGVKSLSALKKIVKSTPFSCPDQPNPVYFEMIHEFGAVNDDWYAWFLKSSKDVYVTSLTLSIMDAGLKPLSKMEFKERVVGNSPSKHGRFTEAYNLASAGDTLCIKCDFTYDGAPELVNYATIIPRDPNLQEDYMKLSKQPKKAEIVTFVLGDTKLYAHKDILTARSSYFQILFDSGMKESQTNEIPIEEAEPKHFQELLDFIYSGLPPKDLPTIAQSLLPLADRYGMLILKNMCITAIISTLSLKNVIAALLLADTHSCPDLKKNCLALMRGNINTLKTAEDFKELKKNPEVLAMVLEDFDD